MTQKCQNLPIEYEYQYLIFTIIINFLVLFISIQLTEGKCFLLQKILKRFLLKVFMRVENRVTNILTKCECKYKSENEINSRTTDLFIYTF